MKQLMTKMGLAGAMAFALQTNAQTLVNPSFEEDTYTVFPGYSEGNGGVITGWDVQPGAGINPGGGSPFADNGTIPDGEQVAFIQSDTALGQYVTGLTPGSDYIVKYFENARGGNRPAIEVAIDGLVIVPAHIVTSVGGTEPYRSITSSVFNATATDMYLSFTKSNPLGGDNTVLIDNVSVVEVPAGTKPIITAQPQGGTFVSGASVTLRADGYGSTPYTYQWLFDGEAIDGATENVLQIDNVTSEQQGTYSLRISNAAGSTDTAEVEVTVLDPVPGVYNTGEHPDGGVLADGEIDPHYKLVVNPNGPSQDAYVSDSLIFPIVAGPWIANDDDSKWIGPLYAEPVQALRGNYSYQTTIDLTGHDYETAYLTGTWATDNEGSIYLNGQDTGLRSPDFLAARSFTISDGFVPGVNVLEFRVFNADAVAGYTGLRVDSLMAGAEELPAGTAVQILRPPTAQMGRLTGSATFTVGAQGSGPVSYQWLFKGAEIAGETSHTLTVENLTAEDAGAYSVRVTNASGSATSDPVTLTVNPQADVTTAKYAGIWIEGIVGRQYRIEYATEVEPDEWQVLTTITLAASPSFHLDRSSPESEQRFYRAVLLP